MLATLTAFSVFAQPANLPVPRQEKLLNGLKVLMWNDAKAEKVSVVIRVHSGAAFDPQNKEGVMQMLADNIFPNEAVREFFTDDLGGSLEITTNHDYIQISATAKSEEFLTMIETLANAVSKISIDKETTAKLRAARLEKLTELEINPVYVADRQVARKLFGTFPYGRAVSGTTESVQKIDYADLIFARDRFFTADNATVAVTGNIKPELAFRAVRRNFGAWGKSDGKIASTFRQPDEPDTKPFVVELSTAEKPEVRFAFRGLSRNDKDYAASEVLAKILFHWLQKAEPRNAVNNIVVRHDEHILPGLFIIGYSSSTQWTESMPKNANIVPASPVTDIPKNVISSLLTGKITDEEFLKAKNDVLTEINGKAIADWWLDSDTFKLSSVSDDRQSFEKVSLTDVQKIAEKLSKNPIVIVLIIQTKENTTTKN